MAPGRLDEPIAVSLEELVTANHFYRHLEATLDLGFVRPWTRELYAGRRRPSLLQQRVEVYVRADADVDAVPLLDGPDVGVVHELSRAVHEHPPQPAIGFTGCREWDSRDEEEAAWQADALLVPRDGAFVLLRRGGSIEDGAIRFGVTEDLFRWRANVTGVVRVLRLLRAS